MQGITGIYQMMGLFAEGLLIFPREPGLLYVLGVLHHRASEREGRRALPGRKRRRRRCDTADKDTAEREVKIDPANEDRSEGQMVYEYLFCAVQYLERALAARDLSNFNSTTRALFESGECQRLLPDS